MAIAAFDLRRLARLLTWLLIVLLAAFVAAGAVLHPLFFVGAGVLGPVFLMDFYYRFGQRRHAILRNFGIFGSLRYVFESLGPEFRQYWIASDTEEKPFSRRERDEIYRYAKDAVVNTAAFGTQNVPLAQDTIRHSMFPLSLEDLDPYTLTFGEERGCNNPFTIEKPFMISAMSFGSLGERAVRALSRGARLAGIAINTGEGGYPKHHLSEESQIIFQMGTAKFGVRKEDGTLDAAKLRELAGNPFIQMVEIKFSQGAKPGKGGLLPAAKCRIS